MVLHLHASRTYLTITSVYPPVALYSQVAFAHPNTENDRNEHQAQCNKARLRSCSLMQCNESMFGHFEAKLEHGV